MMRDQPFYVPGRMVSPAPARSAEHLWANRKDVRQYDGELRDHGTWGVEFQGLRELEFVYGRRWPTRALAIAEADERKAQYLREGGILIGVAGTR